MFPKYQILSIKQCLMDRKPVLGAAMIQFYRWPLSFPPLEEPQNPRACQQIDRKNHTQQMSQGTFWQELWLCQPATLTLIFSSHVFDFSLASAAVASGIHLTVKVCLCLCLCLSVKVCDCLSHLFWHLVTAASIDASRQASNCISRPFDNLGRSRGRQDVRDFNWRVIQQSCLSSYLCLHQFVK